MGVHEQHYPPQTMPQITRLLVNIPERNGRGKEQQILGYYRPMNQISYLLSLQRHIPYYQHSGAGDQCHTEGQVPQEVGDWGTHSVVETEVIDEIKTKTTAHVVDL